MLNKVIIVGAKNPETGYMISSILALQSDTSNSQMPREQYAFVGFLDNDKERQGREFCKLPVLGGFQLLDRLIAEGHAFVNTITSSTRTRHETSLEIRKKGGRFVNFVHPSVRACEAIGVGNYIQEDVVVQANVRIGSNNSIHVGAIVAHDVMIGDSTFVAHAVSISGEVAIGDGVFIGTNASILPRVKIGNWANIGAGSVVLKDIPDFATAVGNPARIIKVAPPNFDTSKVGWR